MCFTSHNVLQISSGLGDFGSLPWHLAVALLVSWIVVFLCIMRGIKSIGKVSVDAIVEIRINTKYRVRVGNET